MGIMIGSVINGRHGHRPLETLETREMAADLALIQADPDFARSIGVTLRNWVPVGGSGELPPPPAPPQERDPGTETRGLIK